MAGLGGGPEPRGHTLVPCVLETAGSRQRARLRKIRAHGVTSPSQLERPEHYRFRGLPLRACRAVHRRGIWRGVGKLGRVHTEVTEKGKAAEGHREREFALRAEHNRHYSVVLHGFAFLGPPCEPLPTRNKWAVGHGSPSQKSAQHHHRSLNNSGHSPGNPVRTPGSPRKIRRERRRPASHCRNNRQRLRTPSPCLARQGDGPLVEGHECFATQPGALVGDRPIGKIAAGIQDGEAKLSSRPVHHHIARIHQTANGRSHVILW